MLSKVKKVFSNKSRKFSTNSKSNENCKTTSVVSVTSSLPDFTREFSTLTEECGYVPTVLVNASKIIEAHIQDKFLFQIQGSVGKVDYLIKILGRDRLSVPRNINIHDVVEAVKVYLNRKATPIVPDEIMTKLIEIHNSDNTEEEIRIISAYRKMLPDVVPSVHFVLLLMNKVAKHSLVNGMDERKLATIFVLDILKPLTVSESHEDYEKNRLKRVQKLPYNIMVVEHLIRNVHIFEFAPYQQVHEPFSPPEDLGWTKEKQIKSFMSDSWKDLPSLDGLDNVYTPKGSPKQHFLDKDGSRDNSPQSYFSRDNTPTIDMPGLLKGVLEEDDKVESLKKSTISSSSRSLGNFKKMKKHKCEKPIKVHPQLLKRSSEDIAKKESTDNLGRPSRNAKHERKHPEASTSSVKNKTKCPSPLKQGVVQQNVSGKNSLENLVIKKAETPVRAERKHSDSAFIEDRTQTNITRGKIDLAKTPRSPPRIKRVPDKPKKPVKASNSSCIPRSPSHASPKTVPELLKNSPQRSVPVKGIPSKYTKRGRIKEQKCKMFKKDEELQPWDGWMTESDDISLIVRTTKNPKTFQFLEKYFMALGPNENIEKIVFDASASSQQETPTKKRGRRNKKKSTQSARNKGKSRQSSISPDDSRSPKPTAHSKSLFNWSVLNPQGRAMKQRLDTAISSPELQGPRGRKVGSDFINRKENKLDVDSNVVSNQTTPRSPIDSYVSTSTHVINTQQQSVKIKSKSSVQWASGENSSLAKIDGKNKPKSTKSTWNKFVDVLIDTSLIGIAIVCAAYIYNIV